MSDIDDIAILSNRIDLGFLSQDLSFMARVLNAHIRWANARLDPEFDAPGGQAALLGVIAMNPGMSQNDLAMAVVLKKSAVTKLVSDLESEGLILREKPSSDRRLNALRLSAAGKSRWGDLQHQMRRQQEPLLAPLSAEECDTLFRLMGRLVVNFADGLDGTATRPE